MKFLKIFILLELVRGPKKFQQLWMAFPGLFDSPQKKPTLTKEEEAAEESKKTRRLEAFQAALDQLVEKEEVVFDNNQYALNLILEEGLAVQQPHKNNLDQEE